MLAASPNGEFIAHKAIYRMKAELRALCAWQEKAQSPNANDRWEMNWKVGERLREPLNVEDNPCLVRATGLITGDGGLVPGHGLDRACQFMALGIICLTRHSGL